MLEPLEKVKFIRVRSYITPDGPLMWKGLAAQTKGNDIYGEIIFLKTEYIDEKEIYYHDLYELGKPLVVSEYEWDGGFELTGPDLEEAKRLYETLCERKLEEQLIWN